MTNTNVLEGMMCPKCGSEGPFKIYSGVWLLFHDDGSAEYHYGDVEFASADACDCPACDYHGTVAVFLNPFTCAETYHCLALSTAHVKQHTARQLSLGLGSNMVMKRETGFFIKLYECTEEGDDPAPWAVEYPELHALLRRAYDAGFRLVEFDRDADTVATLPTYDW